MKLIGHRIRTFKMNTTLSRPQGADLWDRGPSWNTQKVCMEVSWASWPWSDPEGWVGFSGMEAWRRRDMPVGGTARTVMDRQMKSGGRVWTRGGVFEKMWVGRRGDQDRARRCFPVRPKGACFVCEAAGWPLRVGESQGDCRGGSRVQVAESRVPGDWEPAWPVLAPALARAEGPYATQGPHPRHWEDSTRLRGSWGVREDGSEISRPRDGERAGTLTGTEERRARQDTVLFTGHPSFLAAG